MLIKARLVDVSLSQGRFGSTFIKIEFENLSDTKLPLNVFENLLPMREVKFNERIDALGIPFKEVYDDEIIKEIKSNLMDSTHILQVQPEQYEGKITIKVIDSFLINDRDEYNNLIFPL